jgi:hypothetical protein
MFIFSRTAVHYTFSHVKGLLDSKQFTMFPLFQQVCYSTQHAAQERFAGLHPEWSHWFPVGHFGPFGGSDCRLGRDMLWGHTAQRPPADPELFGEPHGREDSELSYIMSHLKHGWDMLGHSEIVFGDSGTMRSFRDSGIFWTTQTMNRTT